MRTYKLIKEYPGSPELGFIAKQSLDGHYTYPSGQFILREIVENTPEFWERVIPLGISEDGYPIYEGDVIFRISKVMQIILPEVVHTAKSNLELVFVKKDNAKEYSNRSIWKNKLSFKIGDKITNKEGFIFLIKDFDFINLSYKCFNNKVFKFKNQTDLKLFKPVLFTTEDGFKIDDVETQGWYCIDKSDLEYGVYEGGSFDIRKIHGELNLKNPNILRFRHEDDK